MSCDCRSKRLLRSAYFSVIIWRTTLEDSIDDELPDYHIVNMKADEEDGSLIIVFQKENQPVRSLSLRDAILEVNGILAMWEYSRYFGKEFYENAPVKRQIKLMDKVRKLPTKDIRELHKYHSLGLQLKMLQELFVAGTLEPDFPLLQACILGFEDLADPA